MWLATMLRKRHQCRIKPPEWMHATNLGNVLKDEKANATAWQQLPYHYIEIAKILFTVAEEDFAEFDMDVNEVRHTRERRRSRRSACIHANPHTAPIVMLTDVARGRSPSLPSRRRVNHAQIRRLVDDIRIVRFDKLEKQFKQVTGANMIRLENLCAMELNLIRPFLLGTLNQYRKLSQVRRPRPRPEQSPSPFLSPLSSLLFSLLSSKLFDAIDVLTGSDVRSRPDRRGGACCGGRHAWHAGGVSGITGASHPAPEGLMARVHRKGALMAGQSRI